MGLSTQQVIDLYKAGSKASANKYKAKIMAVDVNPGAEAAKKKDTLRARFNEAIDSGKWERNVQRMPPEEWKKRAVGKGSTAYQNAVDFAAEAMRPFLDVWLPAMANLKSQVRAMPNATKAERRARAEKAWELAEMAAKGRISGGGY